jgi:formylglycine-generating enzyme required for sulfatase activity
MLGSAWEWCLDTRRVYTQDAAVDPRGPDGKSHMRRGGSWGHDRAVVRCAERMEELVPGDPALAWDDTGFRVCIVPSQ